MSESAPTPAPMVPGLRLPTAAAAGGAAASPRRVPLSEAVRAMATPRVSSNPDEEVSAIVKMLATPRTQGGGLSARSTVDPTLAPLLSPRKEVKKKWEGLVTTNDIAHIRDCFRAVQEVYGKALASKNRQLAALDIRVKELEGQLSTAPVAMMTEQHTVAAAGAAVSDERAQLLSSVQNQLASMAAGWTATDPSDVVVGQRLHDAHVALLESSSPAAQSAPVRLLATPEPPATDAALAEARAQLLQDQQRTAAMLAAISAAAAAAMAPVMDAEEVAALGRRLHDATAQLTAGAAAGAAATLGADAAQLAAAAAELEAREKRLKELNDELSAIAAELGLHTPPADSETLKALREHNASQAAEIQRLTTALQAATAPQVPLTFVVTADDARIAALEAEVQARQKQLSDGRAVLKRLARRLRAARTELHSRSQTLVPLTEAKTTVAAQSELQAAEVTTRRQRLEFVEAELRTDDELLAELEAEAEGLTATPVDFTDLERLAEVVQQQSERRLLVVYEKAEHEEELRDAKEELEVAVEQHRTVAVQFAKVADELAAQLNQKASVAEQAIEAAVAELDPLDISSVASDTDAEESLEESGTTGGEAATTHAQTASSSQPAGAATAVAPADDATF